MFTHPEHRFIYNQILALDSSERPRMCVVEIGSFRGESTAAAAAALKRFNNADKPALPRSVLYTVDPFYGYYDAGLTAALGSTANPETSLPLYKKNMAEYESLTIPIATTSRTARAHCAIPPGSAAAVLVDGDHSYDGCLFDLEYAYELLDHARSGLIIVHDAHWDGIALAISEFLGTHREMVRVHRLGPPGEPTFAVIGDAMGINQVVEQ